MNSIWLIIFAGVYGFVTMKLVLWITEKIKDRMRNKRFKKWLDRITEENERIRSYNGN